MDTGVYIISNKVNGKFYIGSTARSLHKRFISHKSKLRTNKHPNRYLQAAWNKYGEENFEFDVLDECEPHLSLSIELYWINMTGSCDRTIGYNLVTNSKSTLGFKYNDEQRKKLSDIRRGKKAPWRRNSTFPESARTICYKEVVLYNNEGKIIKEYPSIKAALLDLKISRNTAHKMCNYHFYPK